MRWFLPLLAGAICGLPSPAMAGQGPQIERQTLFATIDMIVASPPRSRVTVEHIFGQALTHRPGSDPEFWVSDDISLSDSIVTIDYSDPPFGPMLTLAVRGICITDEQVRERFPGSRTIEFASMHATRPLDTFLYRQSWGNLGFTFPRGENACLEEIVFAPSRD